MRLAEAAEWVRRVGIALLDRRPEDHRACSVHDFVEHDVAHGVAVDEHDPRVIRRPGGDVAAVRALPQRLRGACRQVDANRRHDGLLTRLDREERDLLVVVDLEEVRPARDEHGVVERYGEAACDRNQVRDVVLVPVRVEHHEDLPEGRKHVEELTADEVRVLQGDLRRKQRLRHAARGVHRVQAQVP